MSCECGECRHIAAARAVMEIPKWRALEGPSFSLRIPLGPQPTDQAEVADMLSRAERTREDQRHHPNWSDDDMAFAIKTLQADTHAARNELTRARLVLDLMAQRLGVPRTDEREPYYEWLLEAVEDLRERCGEIEKP